MVNPNYTAGRIETRAPSAVIEEGLRSYMNKVYALMAGAMVITGLVAYAIGMDLKAVINGEATTLIPASMIAAMFTPPISYVIMLAPLGFVFLFGAMINRMSASAAQMTFWAFGALMGVSMASIVAVFTGQSIAEAFLITAIAFGGLSIFGYTTKKNLSGWASFLFMGIFGLIAIGLLNVFVFQSSGLQLLLQIGVLLFSAGITAYETQRLKTDYISYSGSPQGEAYLEKGAVMGALNLYISFINMFMVILQLFGNRE